MKIFISWSGEKSKRIAEAFKDWLPCVIQSLEPYVSSTDIDKGARWSANLAKELQDTSFGILCVTRESISAPWLNFEAGALSKSIDSARVCPFLLDIKSSEIKDSPILQFQMTTATKDDVFKLVNSINDGLGDSKLTEGILRKSFEVFWPKLEADLKEAASLSDAPSPTKKSNKDSTAHIEEILNLVRIQQNLLKSPRDLLPPEYLLEVLSTVGKSAPESGLGTKRSEDTRVWIRNDLLPALSSISDKASEVLNTFDVGLLKEKNGHVFQLVVEICAELASLRIRTLQKIDANLDHNEQYVEMYKLIEEMRENARNLQSSESALSP